MMNFIKNICEIFTITNNATIKTKLKYIMKYLP